MTEFKLKKGVKLRHKFSTPIVLSAATLTDELAMKFLRARPDYIQYFSQVPEYFGKGKTKKRNIWMVCFVYNEIKHLPHVINFWTRQKVKVYVIDNYSDDGTWEYLKENKTPSHRVDTAGAFDLRILQKELVNTLHKIQPDWFIYGAADLYYSFNRSITGLINEVEAQGYNQITTHCYFAQNTGEKKGAPLVNHYYYCKPFTKLTMIGRYEKDIKLSGDHIFTKTANPVYIEGLIINYGGCKSATDQEKKLERREKAWKMGLKQGLGSHYREQRARNWMYSKDELVDIRKDEKYKFYKHIRSICDGHVASQAFISYSMRNFKDAFLTKYNLQPYHDQDAPAIVYGMYKPEDYELLKTHQAPLIVVFCGTDAKKVLPYHADQLMARDDVKIIATSKAIQKRLQDFGIKSQRLPVTPASVDLQPHPRGKSIYCYIGTETRKQFYGYDLAKQVEAKTGLPVIYAKHNSFDRAKLIDVYKECFVGLRLTPFDGVGVTPVELGLMGRRVIFNGDSPNAIPWTDVADICDNVKKQYDNRHIDDVKQVSQSVKDYLSIGPWNTL